VIILKKCLLPLCWNELLEAPIKQKECFTLEFSIYRNSVAPFLREIPQRDYEIGTLLPGAIDKRNNRMLDTRIDLKEFRAN